jgi:hypothetical protein
VKLIEWNAEKSQLLKATRGVSLEEAAYLITIGEFVDIIEHPNFKKYKGQKIYILKIKDYIYEVPFVEKGKSIFLKTIYPTRKLTRKYLKNEKI